jgi:hypothetical protein
LKLFLLSSNKSSEELELVLQPIATHEKSCEMRDSFPSLMARFRELQTVLQAQGRVLESYDFGGFLIGDRTGSSFDIDLLILTVVHGNEPGSLVPVTRLLEEYAKGGLPRGRTAFLVCNSEAAAQSVRFLEKDLNRCFGIRDQKSSEGKQSRNSF